MSVPNAGLTEFLNRFAGITSASTMYVGVGTGTGAESASDTALGTELTRVAVAASFVTDNVLTLKAFFTTAQGNGILGEIGLLNAAASGTLLDRTKLSPTQTKAATKEMIVEYAITLTRG